MVFVLFLLGMVHGNRVGNHQVWVERRVLNLDAVGITYTDSFLVDLGYH